MNAILKRFNKPIYKHIAFWTVVFLLYTTSAYKRFSSIDELLITYFFHVIFQVIIAYTILHFIIPTYKKNKKIWLGIFYVLILFFIINIFHASVWVFFLERVYIDCKTTFKEMYGDLTFLQRIVDWKFIYGHLPIFYLQPLFFLIALQFYEKEYKRSKINEQKSSDELKALKHQLNPHFLFNNLNNLYLLTVEKSDKAPEIIEKLSEILNYILYGCDQKFVSIHKEIELIENYLALEQVRYEDRALVSFKNSITESCKIAPLLLLTFIENAFKHGVSQELKMATVKIELSTDNTHVIFNIFNTKPHSSQKKVAQKKSIGLSNVEHQLNLLYPKAYDLKIEETSESFSVHLKLKKK